MMIFLYSENFLNFAEFLQGKRLLVIATTSRKEVLEEMEMITAFTDVLHLPNLHRGDQVMIWMEGGWWEKD